MLAVQRPSMGSSNPPNHDVPFGYNFDANSNYQMPPPTAPAPGPSLLDNSESKYLENFFDEVNSDHFNYELFDNPPDGSELGHGWDELPPDFMGTTSSFVQQPQIRNHGLQDTLYGDMTSHMNAGPSIPPSTSADVLAAASVLQNGTAARSHSMSDGMFRGQNFHGMNGQSRTQSMSIQPPGTPIGFSQQPDDYMQDNFFKDMVFGGQAQGSMRQAGSSRKVDIHWGSDAAFSQGFIAPPSQENLIAAGGAYKQIVENALTVNIPSSADTTRPPSPVITKSEHRPRARSSANENEDEQDSRPKKRRKSIFPEEAEEEEESTMSVTSKSSKKRKPGKKTSVESPAAESESKRRKSTAAAAAKARENLTEDQKRENHIKSEQKRRTLIREGFEDLGELVPGLRGGGFSKSAVLVMAADWLEDLTKGNEELQRRLDQMEGR